MYLMPLNCTFKMVKMVKVKKQQLVITFGDMGWVASRRNSESVQRDCFFVKILSIAGGGAKWYSPDGEQLATVIRITDARVLRSHCYLFCLF